MQVWLTFRENGINFVQRAFSLSRIEIKEFKTGKEFFYVSITL